MTVRGAWRGLALVIACARALPGAAADAPRLTPSPRHAALFAPPALAHAFRFERTDEAIDIVGRSYRERWPAPDPRSWKIERIAPGEAFDGAALFDRSRLARLYGGRHPRAARGPVTKNGRVVEVVLLLSPYPEPDLRHLNPGTLVMTVTLGSEP